MLSLRDSPIYRQKSKDASGHEHSASVSGKPANNLSKSAKGEATASETNPDEAAEMIAEILYGLYGDEALDHIGEVEAKRIRFWVKAWNALHHPRGKNGRFIPKGSSEAQGAAKEAIGRVLKGDTTVSGEDLAAHLNLLTVKQLKEIHKEHGQPIPGRLRDQLVEAVKGRIGAGKAEGPKKKERKPRKQGGKPESKLPEKKQAIAEDLSTMSDAELMMRKQDAYQKLFGSNPVKGKEFDDVNKQWQRYGEEKIRREEKRNANRFQEMVDFRKSATPAGDVRQHGMTAAEDMKQIKSGDTIIQYAKGGEEAALFFAAEMKSGEQKIPPKLLSATQTVIFSTQKNAHDTHWEKTYGIKDFEARATGGDGNVVVYGGKRITIGLMAHESGHNLAAYKWGNTAPPASSEYGQAQLKEPPVSKYGASSPAEDFAEACKMYVEDPNKLADDFPLKYNALEKLLS